MKVLLKQGRPVGPPRPERLPPPPDVARTWCVAGVAWLPLLLVVVCCRATPVAQPGLLFGVGLPLLCVLGAFAQRHLSLLVGSSARAFTWTLRLSVFALLLGIMALIWLPHATALLANATAMAGPHDYLDAGVVLSGPANAFLALIAWGIGRRLYARAGLLDVQPWERGDEGLRIGRRRLLEGLWQDMLAGAVIVVGTLWVLAARAVTAQERVGAALLTVVALPLYLAAGITVMAWLTAAARRSGWALEGLTLAGRLPSPWSATAVRAAAMAAAVIALVAASPLLGLLHAAVLWAAFALWRWLTPLTLAFVAAMISNLRFDFANFWPRFHVGQAPPVSPAAPRQIDQATGPHLILSLVVLLVLSWIIWWVLVKVLDRVPAVAAVARERRGRALLRVMLAWLRAWWQRGAAFAADEVASYRTRRAARRGGWAAERLAALPPRLVVVALYHRMLGRAAVLGWHRAAGQTPGEFAAGLRDRLPAGDDVGEITAAFLEARYSSHDIPPGQATRVLELWRHARRLLRPRR